MHILVMRLITNGDAPKPIIDTSVVPESDLQKWARRAADKNKEKNKRHTYTIEEVPDDSLTAFIANDRHYDMNKYEALATTLCKKIDELRSDVELFRRYYSEAAEHQSAQQSKEADNGSA